MYWAKKRQVTYWLVNIVNRMDGHRGLCLLSWSATIELHWCARLWVAWGPNNISALRLRTEAPHYHLSSFANSCGVPHCVTRCLVNSAALVEHGVAKLVSVRGSSRWAVSSCDAQVCVRICTENESSISVSAFWTNKELTNRNSVICLVLGDQNHFFFFSSSFSLSSFSPSSSFVW